MDEFRHFWNAADNVVAFVVKDVSETAYIVSNGEIAATLRWIPGPKARQGTQLKLGRLNIGAIEGGDHCKDAKALLASHWKARFNTLFCGQAPPRPNEPPSQAVVLPATYKDQQVPVNLRVWLADHFKFSAVGKKFEETFPQLYNFIKSNPKMEFSDVERLLQSEMQRERSTEKIEFLGLKFPERDLATWGAGIILVIQLYFWVHLRELSFRASRDDFSSQVAWIGLYKSIYARAMTCLTACILPLGVIAFGMWTLGFSLASLCVLILGCLLAIDTAIILQRILNEISMPRQALAE